MHYLAFIHTDEAPGFGVSFPDFPGCVTQGDTLDDALRLAREALAFHVAGMRADGETIPTPRERQEIETDPALAGWRDGATLACVPLISDRGSPKRVNISLPFSVKMIFLRVGWMVRYCGLASGDKIAGGGAFVEKHGYGHEIFNFQDCNGTVYGYVRPPRGGGGSTSVPKLNISKLGATSKETCVDDVLVVWVAKSEKLNSNVVVGWYEDATLYREAKEPPPHANRDYNGEVFDYYASSATADATLLPVDERLFKIHIEKGGGGMGQANVWYADNPDRHSEVQRDQHLKVRRSVLDFISRRVIHPAKQEKNGIKPTQVDPLLRQRIERDAVKETVNYYKRLGYTVDSVENDNVGWDLEAVYEGSKLLIEVKGLSGSDLSVELTPNEYMKMKRKRDSYRLCVVAEALIQPKLSVFAWSSDTKRWEDQKGNPLCVQEIVSARFRLDNKT